jgi:hypothetical protein
MIDIRNSFENEVAELEKASIVDVVHHKNHKRLVEHKVLLSEGIDHLNQ